MELGTVNLVKTEKPLLAILLTFIPGPLLEGYSHLCKHFGLTNLSVFEAISLMWLKEPSIVLGLLGGLGVISWFALLMYYSVKVWGNDYFPIKTMLISMTLQSLIFNVFGVLGHNNKLIQSVSGNYVHASAAAIGGLVSGFLMKRYLF
jgi:hypothetical protein